MLLVVSVAVQLVLVCSHLRQSHRRGKDLALLSPARERVLWRRSERERRKCHSRLYVQRNGDDISSSSSDLFNPSNRRQAMALGLAIAFTGNTAMSKENSWYGAEGILNWVSSDKTESDISPAAAQSIMRETYTVEFVCYLSRFLLNYDQSCNRWWQEQRQKSLATFCEFVTSVEYGLLRYPGMRGTNALLQSLERQHGFEPERRRHLALAFALLPGSRQPVIGIDRLLQGIPNKDIENKNNGGGSVGLIVSPDSDILKNSADAFGKDPLALLPSSQFPKKQNDGYYVIEGLAPLKEEFYYNIATTGRSKQNVTIFGNIGRERAYRERDLDLQTYIWFGTAGAVGCTLTHMALVPLDVVKTRMQTDTNNDYKGTIDGIIKLNEREGWRSLLYGMPATIVGYSWYGMTVYPGFEFFTRALTAAFPSEALHAPIVLLAGALATVVACIGCCPAEAVRIRTVAQPDRFTNCRIPYLSAVKNIWHKEGFDAFFAGFRPLVVRQVIFGVVKFFFFDSLADTIFSAAPGLRATTASRLFVAFISGFVAGTVASLVSQPADAILSATNEANPTVPGRHSLHAIGGPKPVSPADAAKKIFKRDGIKGFYRGALSRCLWAAFVISGQFAIYDILKSIIKVSTRDLTLFLEVNL